MNIIKKNMSLVNRDLTNMDQIGIHENLVYLNLHRNKLNQITGLLQCPNLRHLDLSMNNIVKIKGLESLIGLEMLNLAHNNIEVVENISTLHSLVNCNLSHNKINNLIGFRQFTGFNCKLEFLEIRCNLINSLEHLLTCLKPCRSLQHLIISADKLDNKNSPISSDDDFISSSELKIKSDNPICSLPGYRYSIFSSLINLISLDGTDRRGESKPTTVKTNSKDTNHVKDPEKLQVHFTTSESSDFDQFLSNVLSDQHNVNVINLDSKQNSQHLQPTQQSRTSDNKSSMNEALEKITENFGERFLKLIDERLKDLTKSHSNKELPSKIPVLKFGVSDHIGLKEALTSNQKAVKTTFKLIKPHEDSEHKRTENLENNKKSLIGRKIKSKLRNQHEMIQRRMEETTSANFSRMIENLNQEKELRWKAEKEISELNRRLREEAEEKSDLLRRIEFMRKSEVAAGSSELKSLSNNLEDEKIKRKFFLEKINNSEAISLDLKMKLEESESIKNQLEERVKTEKEVSSILRDEREQMERTFKVKKQEHSAVLMAMKKELEILKKRNENQKNKISELQTHLAIKNKELEIITTKDSKELEDYVQSRISAIENPLQIKIAELKKSYGDLEDEFREALRSEFERFEKVKEAFLASEQTLKECKKENEELKGKDEKNVMMLTELNAIVKEQKGKLGELTLTLQAQTSELKSKINSLDKELKETSSDLEDVVKLRQERLILKSRIESLESLVVGLKSERRIWGEELAQQSSSLAQEKGRLESRIESNLSEIKNLHERLVNESEKNKIKAKIIDDQWDSIKKFKEILSEKEEAIKNGNKKLSDIESQSDGKIEKMREEFTELMERLERCSREREEMKMKLINANKRMEEKEDECMRIKEEWKRMNDEIKAVEKEVMKMSNSKLENERRLEDLRQTLSQEHERDLWRIRDEHTKQLVSMETETQVRLKMAERKVEEVEEEMRDLLKQRDSERRDEQFKMDRLKKMFQEFTGKIS